MPGLKLVGAAGFPALGPPLTHTTALCTTPNPPAGEERRVVIDRDDGIRPGTTPASMAQLKPAFKAGGSTTAGNSSQVGSAGWPCCPFCLGLV